MNEYLTHVHGMAVTVDKDGGGTVGRVYDGSWTVSVANGPVYVLDNDVLHTGQPRTHEQVAQLAYLFSRTVDDE